MGKKLVLAVLALGLTTGAAFADANASGIADVTVSLYNFGVNSNGGTGSGISEVLFGSYNPNFNVAGSGPGSGSILFGGGLLDGGLDEGAGSSWYYFGENVTSGFESTNSGVSDAAPTYHGDLATEDTYNELTFKITNSAGAAEWFDIKLADGVAAQVSLDNSASEYGWDKALLDFGYSASNGDFTGNASQNYAYAITGEGYGTDTFDYVSNSITQYYTGRLNPGASIYFSVVTENTSAVGAAAAPSPAAVIPFTMGLLGVMRRRKIS